MLAVHTASPEVLADTLTRGFEGYAVPISVTPASLAIAERVDSVDLVLSRAMTRDGEPVGAALIARRGEVSRLASMAIVPEARGQGVSRVLMTRLLDEARARGDRAMELEVIEQNVPAVRLYESFGFERRRRLVGYEGSPRGHAHVLTSISRAEVAEAIRTDGAPNLPWQLSAETIAQLDATWLGFRAGASVALVSDPRADVISIRTLVAPHHADARRLLDGLFAEYPGKRWRVSALCPEEESAVFESVGLVRTELSQLQMTKRLVDT